MQFKKLKTFLGCLKKAASLMIGIPDYPAYVKHLQVYHPDKPIMSYEEFFIERQQSRYGSRKQGRCC